MTEREKYLNHRIDHLREMTRELEAERAELQRKRIDLYLNQLEGCRPMEAIR